MSPVKLIHVLKRLEILDRDIQELHEMADNLTRNRTYSNALKISVELQINNLLNERVKLMELRIENPPEHLVPGKREVEEPSKRLTENRGKFNLDDYETTYLDKVLNKKGGISESNLEQSEIDILVDSTRGKKSDSSKATTKTKTTKSAADLLKDMPQVEY